jgi:hypothetical protein
MMESWNIGFIMVPAFQYSNREVISGRGGFLSDSNGI